MFLFSNRSAGNHFSGHEVQSRTENRPTGEAQKERNTLNLSSFTTVKIPGFRSRTCSRTFSTCSLPSLRVTGSNTPTNSESKGQRLLWTVRAPSLGDWKVVEMNDLTATFKVHLLVRSNEQKKFNGPKRMDGKQKEWKSFSLWSSSENKLVLEALKNVF